MKASMQRAVFGFIALVATAPTWAATEPPQPGDWAMPARQQTADYQRIARNFVLDTLVGSASTFTLTFYRNTDPSGIAVEQDLRFKLGEERLELEYRLTF